MKDLGESRWMIDLSAPTSFLEKALINGNEEVRDLVHEALETLLESDQIDLIRPSLGYNSRIWLDWVKDCLSKGSGAGPRPDIQRVKTNE